MFISIESVNMSAEQYDGAEQYDDDDGDGISIYKNLYYGPYANMTELSNKLAEFQHEIFAERLRLGEFVYSCLGDHTSVEIEYVPVDVMMVAKKRVQTDLKGLNAI